MPKPRALPKKVRTEKAKLVFVVWWDSAGVSDELDLHELPEPMLMRSAGVLVGETEHHITMAQDTWDDVGHLRVRQVITVPKVAVYEIKRITV